MIKKIINGQENFPKKLATIDVPPKHIYARGDINLLSNTKCISIVGTRKCSYYGRTVTRNIVSTLSKFKFTIVSGLALGIDAVAHASALSNNGKTIAVLGSGLDDYVFYPQHNFNLSKEIIQNQGLLISEYPPKTGARKHHFIERNRIIAGLSKAVIVIEAPIKSGALITARHAMEQGKDVFALPGDITKENSEGTNHLIKSGAHPIISTEDLIEDLKLIYSLDIKEKEYTQQKEIQKSLTKNQKVIIKIISKKPIHIDKIIEESTLEPVQVLTNLTELELEGIVCNVGNSIYQRNI